MTTKQIKNKINKEFNLSYDDQQILYHIYEDNDFSYYIDRIKKFVLVEQVSRNNAFLKPFYHYELKPSGEKQRSLLLDFACALMNYACRARSLEQYEAYIVSFGFGRRILKALI